MALNKIQIEKLVRDVIAEYQEAKPKEETYSEASGVISCRINDIKPEPFDTGVEGDKVLLKDVYSLEQSKNLGCGIMEMEETTFDWTLNYDEIDYVIEGELSVIIDGEMVTAKAGEIILIPANSTIKFHVPNYAKFMYVTYPANWENQ